VERVKSNGCAYFPSPSADTPADNMPARKNVDINVALVETLIAAQFPQWADLPIKPVAFGGVDNRTFQLGKEMSVRLPSAEGYSAQVEKEHRWLPKLAPLLPLPIPIPLAMGVPADGYPWHWSIYRWLEGENAAIERIDDPCQFAIALAQFLAALQRVDPMGGPPPGSHNGTGLERACGMLTDAIAYSILCSITWVALIHSPFSL
jgi:aminoglycoside phosphotransferase (APT) family kinase protein